MDVTSTYTYPSVSGGVLQFANWQYVEQPQTPVLERFMIQGTTNDRFIAIDGTLDEQYLTEKSLLCRFSSEGADSWGECWCGLCC